MKKIIALFILSAAILTLAACSKSGRPTESDPAAPAASDTDATTALLHTPPASSTDTQTKPDKQTDNAKPDSAQAENGDYEKALACVGRTVEELYAAVGEPVETPAYGPSCLTEGAEDGMLIYDGFSVWTVRTQTEEVVHDVYPDE